MCTISRWHQRAQHLPSTGPSTNSSVVSGIQNAACGRHSLKHVGPQGGTQLQGHCRQRRPPRWPAKAALRVPHRSGEPGVVARCCGLRMRARVRESKTNLQASDASCAGLQLPIRWSVTCRSLVGCVAVFFGTERRIMSDRAIFIFFFSGRCLQPKRASHALFVGITTDAKTPQHRYFGTTAPHHNISNGPLHLENHRSTPPQHHAAHVTQHTTTQHNTTQRNTTLHDFTMTAPKRPHQHHCWLERSSCRGLSVGIRGSTRCAVVATTGFSRTRLRGQRGSQAIPLRGDQGPE